MKLSAVLWLCLCLILGLQAYSQKYVMVWNDEFNNPGLPDSTKWDYEIGGSDLAYYTDHRSENARIVDTVLIIEARKEAYMGSAYTSACLISKYKGDWQYGKFEIRAKVPAGKGTWPAIWMMPTNSEYGWWPKSGEIDIMEYVGFDASTLYFNAHFEGTNGSGHQNSGGNTITSQPYNKFITYTLIWTPTQLEWWTDGVKRYTYIKPSDDPRLWPFNKIYHLILNLAYGGTWGAMQGIDDTKLPHKFLVDYVRIYQLQEAQGPFSLKIEPPVGGTVKVAPQMNIYPEGTLVKVTAIPNANYEFDKWLHVGSANPLQIEISKQTTLIPLFKKKNEIILNGDFSLWLTNWADLYFSNVATQAATRSVVDGVCVVNVSKPGTASWQIAEQQGNIPIEKDATYLITFDAWADNPNQIDVFLSKNHDDYGGYFSTTKNISAVKQSFSWTVKMTKPSDPNCRFGFGFGKFTGDVYFDNVSIQKQLPTGIDELAASVAGYFEMFPNPAQNFLDITNKSHKTLKPTISLYNLQGQLITILWENKPMAAGQQIHLDLDDFKVGNGVSLVNISTPEKSVTCKLIINRL